MAFRRRILERECPSCGRQGTMTYEEDDQSGETTRWIHVTGCYRIGYDGKPVCVCGERSALEV